MPVAAWPLDVPQNELLNSYSEKIEQNIIEFAPEVGPAKRRRRSSINAATLTFETLLRAAAVASLRTFYRTTLADGALPFTRRDPRTGGTATFQFQSPPSIRQLNPALFAVSFALREMP